MLLKSLLDPQRTVATIDNIELWFKKLTWAELETFQKEVKKVEELDDEKSTVALCSYILDKYTTDEEGNKVIDKKDVKDLPVSFCITLVDKFLDKIKAPEETELRKK